MKHTIFQKSVSVFLFCSLILIIKTLFAQQSKIDSLFSELGSMKEDTNRVLTLYYLSVAHNNTGNPQNAIKFSKQGKELAEKLRFKKGTSN